MTLRLIEQPNDTTNVHEEQKLEALKLVLAAELISGDVSYQDEPILHDDLVQRVIEKLDLDSPNALQKVHDLVLETMDEWNWRILNLDIGTTTTLYCRRERRFAGRASLFGKSFVVQADESFPSEGDEILDTLLQSDFAVAHLGESKLDQLMSDANRQAELDLLNAYMEKSKLSHRYTPEDL